MNYTSVLDKNTRTFNERSSGKYKATLLDNAGSPIKLVDITDAELTLFNRLDNTTINSRNDQDILNNNNVTIHATSGLLTWDIQPLDNVIVDTTLNHGEVEEHIALFKISGISFEIIFELPLFIRQMKTVP